MSSTVVTTTLRQPRGTIDKNKPWKLCNASLCATVDRSTGRLLAIRTADESQGVLDAATIRYRCDGRLVSENGTEPGSEPVTVVRVERARHAIRSILTTPELRITRSLELPGQHPLLRLRYEFEAAAAVTLHGPALLRFDLPDDVQDPATDERDCYFDGAELGSGRELPCWRVLYAGGYRRGLLVATRSKWQMSHVMYERRWLEILPHVRAQQQVDYTQRDGPIKMTKGQRLVVELELGPWHAKQHKAILQAAKLDTPVRVTADPAHCAVPPDGAGQIFWLADLARPAAVSTEFHDRRWLKTSLPWNPRQSCLIANAGCRPPSISIRPKITGLCHVFVRGSQAATVGLHFSGDPYPMYRYGIGGTAFHSVLDGPDQACDLDFGVVDMTGRSVRVVANHNGHWPARLDYLRFEPLTPEQADEWRARQTRPRRLLAGIPDSGDIFFNLMDRRRLDPRIIAGNIWEQARCGFNRLYWQMHGSFTFFQTRIGTPVPMVCYGHGAFEPQIKSYPLFLRKHDILAIAAKTCRELGVEFWGTTRLNAYMSGKRDRFFQEHPQYAEITEDGVLSGNKICYAIEQVRDYQRSILVEAAAYGLDGIMLGVLRHAPLLLYHPVLVSGFRNRYGKLPPRHPGRHDPQCTTILPPDDEEHRLWFAYRASFMTQFARDLKRDLKNRGLGHVKLSLWVRPNHCLFDGIDLPVWLAEGLCDEVVSDIYHSLPLDEPTPQWRAMVQAKVPLLRGIGFGNFIMAPDKLQQVLADNYAGVCAYGTEQFAQTRAYQPVLDMLQQAPVTQRETKP